MDNDQIMGWHIRASEDGYQLYDAHNQCIAQGSYEACRTQRFELLRSKTGWRPTRLVVPTLGGRQWWSDFFHHCGWRIQRHARKAVFRLLDPHALRRAQGRYDECRLAAEHLFLEHHINWSSDEVILIVHGILRSGHSCAGLQRYLRQQGHQVATVEYASSRISLNESATALQHTIEHLLGIHRVHLITHSLGGLVVRRCLANAPLPSVQSVASIFPPSQGSSLVERIHTWLPYRWITGPAGQEIRPHQISSLPPPPVPTLIIAGDRGWGIGRILGTAHPSDGTVGVEETKLPGCEHHVLPVGHTFGMNDPQVCHLLNQWLERMHTDR